MADSHSASGPRQASSSRTRNGIEHVHPTNGPGARRTATSRAAALPAGVHSGGFRLSSTHRRTDIPIVLAGLRGRMLQTAAALGDGVLNLVPLAAMPLLMESIRCGRRSGRKIARTNFEAVCRHPVHPRQGERSQRARPAAARLVCDRCAATHHTVFPLARLPRPLETTVTEWRRGAPPISNGGDTGRHPAPDLRVRQS